MGTGGTSSAVAAGRTGTGSVSVFSGGTLAGTGTLRGAVTINSGGVLAPGDNGGGSTGRLDAVNNVTLSGTGELQLQVGGSTLNDAAGIYDALGGGMTSYETYVNGHIANWNNRSLNSQGMHDLLNFTGTGKLIGTAGNSETIRIKSSYSVQLGDIFDLVDWVSVGSMTNIAGSSTFVSGTSKVGDFDLSDFGDLSLSGLAWDTSRFATYGILIVVPEPSRMLLLMFGLLGLFFRRRRRNGLCESTPSIRST